MTPQFKFTLTWNPLDGSPTVTYVIPANEEPRGWKQARLHLERHSEYHSLIEYLEAPLDFYGPAWGYLLAWEEIDGIRTNVTLTCDIQHDDNIGFENIFTGLIAFKEIEARKKADRDFIAKVPFSRNDLWARFIARYDTPVNIQSTEDLYGNAVAQPTVKTLILTPQKIRKRFRVEQLPATDPNYFRIRYQFLSPDKYASIELPNVVIDELKIIKSVGNIVFPTIPLPLFPIKEAGRHIFDIKFVLSNNDAATGGIVPPTGLNAYLQVNKGAFEIFTSTIVGTSGIDERIRLTYNATKVMHPTDNIRIWIQNDNASGDQSILQQGLFGEESYIDILADTEFVQTTGQGFLIHDVGKAIVDRISLPDKFYSPFLGHTSYTDIAYDEIGCGFAYFLMKGLQARGYNLDDKIFSISLSDWYKSSNAILNLGLGYRIVGGIEKIVVDAKETFYNDSRTSVVLLNVPDMVRVYDEEIIAKTVEVGYKKSLTEAVGIIDDPQTTSKYATIFETQGTELSMVSNFIAGSLAFEETRRQSVDKSKDWKFDDDTFIIAINAIEESSDIFIPELAENFSDISNILNPESRYNYRLWPVWNLLRWANFLYGALMMYKDTFFTFVEGHGNYDAQARMNPDSDCLLFVGDLVSCKGNIAVDTILQRSSPIHSHKLFKFSVPMSWQYYQAIRDNRDDAIGIGTVAGGTFDYTFDDTFTEEGVFDLYFIKSLIWSPYNTHAEFMVWLKEPFSTNETTTTTTTSSTTSTTSTTTTAPYSIRAVMSESVAGNPSFDISFDSGCEEKDMTCNSSVGLDHSDVLQSCGNADVDTQVIKTTDGGLAVGTVAIDWRVNAVSVHTVSIPPGGTVNPFYTFTGLSSGDDLEIIINET